MIVLIAKYHVKPGSVDKVLAALERMKAALAKAGPDCKFYQVSRAAENQNLLILYELGYVPHDARSADILFHIVSQRHERASTIITTNLAYKKWGEVFDGATSIHATVDRFAQHCHVVDIDGESYRQKKPEPPTAKPAARRRG